MATVFKKVKSVEWDKTYIVNKGTDKEDSVVSGIVGTVEDFKTDYEKRFKIKAETVHKAVDEEVEDDE